MRIIEGVIDLGCQSSVGHRSIGRLWEYDFFKRYKVALFLYIYLYIPWSVQSTRKPIAYTILKCLHE